MKFHRLGKRFGYQWVIRELNGELNEGEICGLFGPNGAGKSTLLSLLAGTSRPTEGHITIEQPSFLLGHKPMFYSGLSAIGNLKFFGNFVRARTEEIEKALKETGLWRFRNDTPAIFSRGMLQRLMIARLLILKPAILFLDEPFTGLDTTGRTMLAQLLKNFGHPDFHWSFSRSLVVEHDKNLVSPYINTTWELKEGQLSVEK